MVWAVVRPRRGRGRRAGCCARSAAASQMRFRDRATIEVEAHVAQLQASVASIEHHERPAYLDRLQLLREQVFLLNHLYAAVFIRRRARSAASSSRSAARVDPSRARAADRVRGPVGVGVDVARRRRAPRPRKRAAPNQRLARHLFDLGTAGRAGQGDPRRRDRRTSSCARRARGVGRVVRRRVAAALASACWHTAAWTLFGLAYVGVGRLRRVGARTRPPAMCCSRSAAGANLSRYLGVTVGQTEFLRWTLDAAQRLAWLEDYAVAPPRDRRAEAGARAARPARSASRTCRSSTRAPTRGCCAT